MRFFRERDGSLALKLRTAPTWEAFLALTSVIETVFRGELQGPLYRFAIAGQMVTLEYEWLPEVTLYTEEAEGEGTLYDIANYLGAHTAELGIEIEREA